MNKQELIAKIVKDTGLTKVSATGAVESLLDGIEVAEEGQRRDLRRFRLVPDVDAEGADRAQSPTGATVKVPKRRVVRQGRQGPQGLGQLVFVEQRVAAPSADASGLWPRLSSGGPSRQDGPRRLL